MTNVQILAQPTSFKMTNGESFIAYGLYARIPKEPTEEDLEILDIIDIRDSMFVFVPVKCTSANDGITFTDWMPNTDIKVFRIERVDILLAAPLSAKIVPEYDKYIAEQKIVLSDAIHRLLKQLELNFEPKEDVGTLMSDMNIEYLAKLHKVEETKH